MQTIKLGMGLIFSTVFFCSASHAEDSVAGDLRKREHVLSWELTWGSSSLKPEGFDKTKSKSSELNLAYQYNFGWWALGGGLSTDISEDDDNDETEMSTFAIEVQGNFIENRPGNDLIPYAYLQLGSIKGEMEVGSDSIDISGNGWAYGIGLEWYPFGELFAVNFELSKLNADLEYEGPASSVDADFENTNFSIGYKLAF